MCDAAPGIATRVRPWRSFAALGDSFTEGLEDEGRFDGRHRGWADRVADRLAERSRDLGASDFSYANLAVRGRLMHQVIVEQVPAAVDLRPDLVTLGAGVNDTLRPHFDVRAVATDLENGVRALRAAGADVLVFAFGDPSRRSRLMGPVAERIRLLNTAVEAIAARYGCYRVSFWQVAAFDDPQLWAPDWLHLSPRGHAVATDVVLESLGVGDARWRTPLVPLPRPGVAKRARANAVWTRDHLAPWIMRRIRGESSGDDTGPKQPSFRPWPPDRADDG